jgi:hypothetical protein
MPSAIHVRLRRFIFLLPLHPGRIPSQFVVLVTIPTIGSSLLEICFVSKFLPQVVFQTLCPKSDPIVNRGFEERFGLKSELHKSVRAPLIRHWSKVLDPLPRLGFRHDPTVKTVHQELDFSLSMQRLIADIVSKVDLFQHIDASRILIGMTPARKSGGAGLQARITPMRFENGSSLIHKRGCTYQIQRFFVDHREMMYVLVFCMPRFLNRPLHDQFITVFHELYHISEKFDGDLRRHPGRYQFHTANQKDFDRIMGEHAQEYLRMRPDPSLYDFLGKGMKLLLQRYDAVTGYSIPKPLMIRMPKDYPGIAANRR